MDELLQKVLAAVGKSEAEFHQEVEKLKNETDQAKQLEAIKQEQAQTSALLLEFMEYMTTGGI